MTPYYENNGIAIYFGDALEVMPTLAGFSAKAVVSDPPFTFSGGMSNGRSAKDDSQIFQHWMVSVFRELYRVATEESAWFLWSDWRAMHVYDQALAKAAPDYHESRWVSQVLMHDREMIGMGSPFRNQTDWIALIRGKKTDFNGRIPKNQPNVIRSYWYYGKHPHHPAEKDVSVAERLIGWISDTDDLLIDPFMGSAPVLIAAQKLGRRAIGIESDERYCEVAARRLMQLPLAISHADSQHIS